MSEITAQIIEIKGKDGLAATITNYGARLVSLFVPDREGKVENIVLNYPNLDFYTKDPAFLGATIGRFGNRIADGRFELEGKEFLLKKNHPDYILHGGENGFHNAIWKVAENTKNSLLLSHDSPSGSEGFPGNLKVTAFFEFDQENKFNVSYSATTDAPTPINLTFHPYFNLSGDFSHKMDGHHLKIDSEQFLPTNESQIPTGELKSVEGTPFDFRRGVQLKKALSGAHPQMQAVNGFDHSFVIERGLDEMGFMASVSHPESGREMAIYSNQPAVQLYTTNGAIKNTLGNESVIYPMHSAICLEPQNFPDAPNQPNFPNSILQPGEKYEWKASLRFFAL